MDAINGNRPDLEKITTNLDSLVGALAARDTMIRRLSTNVTQSTSMLAGQRDAAACAGLASWRSW